MPDQLWRTKSGNDLVKNARARAEEAFVSAFNIDVQPQSGAPAVMSDERLSWWRLMGRLIALIGRTNVSFLASAVAFYGMLSVFPGLAVVVSTYGLVADPASVERQLALIGQFLPQEALTLISDQLHGIVTKNSSELSIGFLIGLFLALWSARAASSSLMTALNIIYAAKETRGFFKQQAVAIVLTLFGGGFGIVALTLVAIIPAIVELLPNLDFVPGWHELKDIISNLRWPILAAFIALGFGSVYRFAPNRTPVSWALIAPGAIAGMALWILGSVLFSVYVSSFGSYDRVYGSLGAVIVLLMWFYVGALSVLVGATVNAELERSWPRRSAKIKGQPQTNAL